MIELKKSDRIIVIVGLPATGKTTTAKEIVGRKLFSTDDFLGEEDFLWACILEESEVVVEGTLGYNLLLRGLTTTLWKPDLIIMCLSKSVDRSRRFEDRGKNLQDCASLDRQLLKKWYEYVDNPYGCKRIIEHIT